MTAEETDSVIGKTNVKVFRTVHIIHSWKYQGTKLLAPHLSVFQHTCQYQNKLRYVVAAIIGISLELVLSITNIVLLNVTKVNVLVRKVLN